MGLGIILKFLGPAGIGATILSLILGVLLVVQKGETRHWHKQSDGFEKLYHAEQSAHQQTVINYQNAANQARAADAANKARVEAEQRRISQERDQAYEARIADARARAERLRQQLAQAAANPGGAGAAPVPVVPGPTGGVAGPPTETGLSPDDALTATEQAIQLDELIKWVHANAGITR